MSRIPNFRQALPCLRQLQHTQSSGSDSESLDPTTSLYEPTHSPPEYDYFEASDSECILPDHVAETINPFALLRRQQDQHDHDQARIQQPDPLRPNMPRAQPEERQNSLFRFQYKDLDNAATKADLRMAQLQIEINDMISRGLRPTNYRNTQPSAKTITEPRDDPNEMKTETQRPSPSAATSDRILIQATSLNPPMHTPNPGYNEQQDEVHTATQEIRPPPYKPEPFIHNPLKIPQEFYNTDGELAFCTSKTHGTCFALRGSVIPFELDETLISEKGDWFSFSLRMTNKNGRNKPVIKCNKPKHINYMVHKDPISIEATCKNKFQHKAKLTSYLSTDGHHTTILSNFKHLKRINFIPHCKDSCYAANYGNTDCFLMIRGLYAKGRVLIDIPIMTVSKISPRSTQDREDSNHTTFAMIEFPQTRPTLAEPTPYKGRPPLITEYTTRIIRQRVTDTNTQPPSYPGHGTYV
jgi:hypothetical protein